MSTGTAAGAPFAIGGLWALFASLIVMGVDTVLAFLPGATVANVVTFCQ